MIKLGEDVNFKGFSNSNKNDKKYIKSYEDFFNNKCFKKEGLSIERINSLLKNEAEKFPQNTNNPFVSKILPLNHDEKMNNLRLNTVYNDTLGQFFALEDVKNLNLMDDDQYLQTINKFSSKIKEINYEYKIDQTIFQFNNKVNLSLNGMVAKSEFPFFKVYALYKNDGGHLSYDELKKEYTLRPILFNNYLTSSLIPVNIIYGFAEDECPVNSVCIDPNGIVVKSKGVSPNQMHIKKNKSIC